MSGPRVRYCRAADRPGILALGHAAGVPEVLAPRPLLRLRWFASGTCAAAFVAVEERGQVVGSIQFVRDRRDPGTWMFGHWRVLGTLRQRGIGRLLLRDGARRIPGLRALYSYVDRGNDGSVRAHEALGFERGARLQGQAIAVELAASGPVAPAPRLVPVERAGRPLLLPIYAQAMGDLWLRLFPGEDGGDPGSPVARLARLLPRGRGEEHLLVDGGRTAGFIVRRRGGATLFLDPGAGAPGLLSRTAARLIADGLEREALLDLRGLTSGMLARPGPIAVQMLMGMPDVTPLLG
ncbi:MAG: GNAT family N-acetyltransferase [Candidatus Polarisedimenticolia bacterium]